jgi:hypothetical protein
MAPLRRDLDEISRTVAGPRMGNGPVEEGLGRAFQHGTGTSNGQWPR